DMIAGGATANALQRAAIANGMAPLRDVAVARVRRGETTLQEIERVLGDQLDDEAAEPGGPPAVLVMNPDPAWRRMARALLEGGGFRVHEATDADAAAQLMREGLEFSLTVTDTSLPMLAAGRPPGLLTAGAEEEGRMEPAPGESMAPLGGAPAATTGDAPTLDWARFAATVQTAVRRDPH
ncbi:MAG TPA: hypothetical protein VG818_13655, partial [Gemmatimonadaceae bacterium]|nr:hypothetical protein [Gemmatimonadaceae bacterium]